MSHVMIMVQSWLFQVSTDPYQVSTVHSQVLVFWSEYQNIEHPNCILFYNKPMGDVNVLDSLVSNYIIDTHGKKWHQLLFINATDVLKKQHSKYSRWPILSQISIVHNLLKLSLGKTWGIGLPTIFIQSKKC